MKYRSSIYMLCLSMLFPACSNTRFLAKDQLLYTGKKKIEIINTLKTSKSGKVKSYVKSVTEHKVNNALFGRRVLPPVGLWTHNYIKTDETKKFRNWIHKTFSSYPILVSDVNPVLRAAKIENDLFDRGYFHTTAWSRIDTNKGNPKKASVSYFVRLAPPNFYNNIISDTLGDEIDTLIARDVFMKQIRHGDQFNLEKLKAAREDLSKRIQDKGYFYFLPEFIEMKADTAVSRDSINLVIGKQDDLPQSVLSVYKLNNILVFVSQGTDTTSVKSETLVHDGIQISTESGILHPEILVNSIYFRKGDTYSYRAYQNTVGRLNSLGIFRYVNISYIQNSSDSLSRLLDVKIDLIMSENINLDFEADLATKSSGFFGPLFSAGISHGNTFRGAELLKVALNGGFEWQWGAKSIDQIGTYSYQAGINSGLTLPALVFPSGKRKNRAILLQRTTVNLDLSLLNRTAFYKMLSIKTNLNYQWSKDNFIRHSFYPIYLNSVRLLASTAAFDSVVNENIYIRKSFEEQFILGTKYEFSFSNTAKKQANNFFFQAGVSTSGNLIDLFERIKNEPSARPYQLLNNVYSQYMKFSSDFRYYRNGYNSSLVFRVYTGIGVPLGNSKALPYIEQFFSGGAFSIRAFTARYLGPGSFHSADHSGFIDQSGDIKLESNLEYRFDMSKVLKGALFIETGNIWLVNEDTNRPGANFDIHSFFKQLAVGTGFGLRFDFTFFVMRADIGFPLRNPYTTDGKNWLPGAKSILSGGLFNLAIGYPF